jgi:26S proteasome regulatory subunit N10
LALKHRQGKNHRPRIVVFVGSPLEVDTNEFTKLAKRLKKEKISIDIVIFGEEVTNLLNKKYQFIFFWSI